MCANKNKNYTTSKVLFKNPFSGLPVQRTQKENTKLNPKEINFKSLLSKYLDKEVLFNHTKRPITCHDKILCYHIQ